MSAKDELQDFEKKLETAIKSVFEKAIQQDGEFEISADYDTHSRLNELVEGLDLEVYGMSVTPSEFTITFEFCGLFQNIITEAKPDHCHVRLENDGNYNLTIGKNDLKHNWFLGITDINYNTSTIPEDLMSESLKQLSQTLLLKVLSN
jgi:hypothetical protein